MRIYSCSLWLQVDKGIRPEIVRSVLAERASSPCLAAKTAYKVSRFA
jgi:glycyl-tRNA synthetase